jgi:hypothetical protein
MDIKETLMKKNQIKAIARDLKKEKFNAGSFGLGLALMALLAAMMFSGNARASESDPKGAECSCFCAS